MAKAAIEREVTADTWPAEAVTTSRHRVGPNVAANNSYWAGYVADNTKGDTYSSVTGNWTEPTLLCGTNQTEIAGFWVGLDGYIAPASTVEQTGTMAVCFAGNPFYYSWWQMYPGPLTIVGNGVSPRDAITATVTSAGGGNFNLVLTDTTATGKGNPNNNINVTRPCAIAGNCPRTSAEWIAEAPSGPRGYWPLPDFQTWTLTGGTATSNRLVNQPISAFPNTQLSLTAPNPPGQAVGVYPLAPTGVLNAAGNSFTTTWSNSY